MTTKTKLVRWLSVALLISAPIETLAAFWWWATFGMSSQVGTAHFITVVVTGMVGAALLCLSLDLADDDRRDRQRLL